MIEDKSYMSLIRKKRLKYKLKQLYKNTEIALLLFLVTIVSSCSFDSSEKRTNDLDSLNNNPQFDWFKYEGNDPIYRNLSVGNDEYINPIIAGFYPDPSIVRAGDDYYLVTSTFSYYPGIPIFHSKDLVNWHQVGFVMEQPSVLALGGLELSAGLFAPSISYHDGIFYVINTFIGGKGNYIVTSTNPAGNWSDPIWLKDVGGIDPSIFFDDNGDVYILNNDAPKGGSLYPGHRAIWIRKYDIENNRTIGESKQIINGGTDISKKPIWIEAPHMMKVNGKYYLYAAQGGTGPNHSEVVFRGNSPMGPFIPYSQNPILTQRNINKERAFDVEYTGHADMVKTQNGEWWCVFLGVRTYNNEYFNTGRETFLLPVSWQDGWPTILPKGDTVPVKLQKPNLPQGQSPEIPTHGNFVHKDNFDETRLGDYWTMIRTPLEQWWNFTDNGFLKIEARPAMLSGKKNPSFIGRRQQHLYGSASAKMIYKPKRVGDTAGIVAFQNPHNYYLLGVTLTTKGKTELFVEKMEDGESSIIASKVLDDNAENIYYLKIGFKGGRYDFFYGFNENKWHSIYLAADGTILSTNKAGGFVGTVIGMYAYSSDKNN